MQKVKSSGPEAQPQGRETSPQGPLSLSKKHCENQGTLLQFDRQAPGRISTSPTLRRLRGSGRGTSFSLSQQDALQVPIWGSWRALAGSPGHQSKSPLGSPKDSPHSLYPSSPHSGPPADPSRALSTADSMESQTGSPDEDPLPVPQPISQPSLHQPSLPAQEDCGPPSPSPRHPNPQIFVNTLKYLQNHEYLLDVDLWRLFANLEELTQTSLGFVNSLFSTIKDYVAASEASPLMDFISVLRKYFRGSLCQSHQMYCLNYSAAVFYLETLRQRDDFGIYLKWCEQNEHCRRLHLPELLVAPLHRLTRYPLLLKNIWKRSADSTEKILIYSIKDKVEKSLQSTRFLDVYLFLFDDFLLVTKTKRNKKKLGGSDTGIMCPSLTPELQTIIKEGGSCTVLDQPIPLDRLVVKSIDLLHVSVFGLRNAFLLQHENRYRQCTAAFLLQAQTENDKKAWIAQITAAISCFNKNQETKKISLFTLPAESSEI
ncbi:Pleckstrin homology domain-containing family G member 7 [Fukomys damarensis]|uniref:Pleckstrin homology domain-containing family G member 7 n=1 Tax=Fukomys damarensis TaxID=885580 RepID=A0A091E7Q8_FUKDA|nr:Pleckstrin homology domain-containing family G member 7 [Fukomys damarensis]